MNKYIAKIEVEIEIEAKNLKDANELLSDINFDKTSFGTKGNVTTKNNVLKSFNEAN